MGGLNEGFKVWFFMLGFVLVESDSEPIQIQLA